MDNFITAVTKMINKNLTKKVSQPPEATIFTIQVIPTINRPSTEAVNALNAVIHKYFTMESASEK